MLDAKGTDANGAGRSHDPAERARLRGWKEIGRFFGVDERTVKRWEGARGLPVHRLPGEARAPVFAFADELNAWVEMSRATADSPPADGPPAEAPPAPRRLWGLMWGMLALAMVAALWFGVRAIEGERLAETRTEELARLAGGQVAALNDSLESPPGTVAVRAGLATEAVEILGRVADVRGSDGDLRLEAAEGWRRLAVLQNAIDRPSLRDRAAARQSLEKGLALLAGDPRPEAAVVRARLSIEAARQAAGGGALEEARGFLARAEPVALGDPGGALAQDWWLASAEVAGWAGDHPAAVSAARRARVGAADAPPALLREVRARDLEAEALYYLGDIAGAKAVYAQALEAAAAGADRWPTDSRLRWGLLRQQWNLGSTLVTAGEAKAAIPLLGDALAGWEALARADPSDEALAAWVRATRLSMGQALAAAGDRAAAIRVLSEVAAERRRWLASRPEDGDRRRMLVKGLATLGDALAKAGRRAEACLLYDEAEELVGRMEADGQLTGHDRGGTLRLLRSARSAACAGGP